MMRETPQATVLLAEVAEVLAECGGLRCVPSVEMAQGIITLVVTVPVQDLGDLELHERLRRVRDIAQARLLSERYGIPPEHLERYIAGDD